MISSRSFLRLNFCILFACSIFLSVASFIPRPSHRSPFSLEAKKETKQGNEIPANLKRKVSAKRPPLGHVVPQHTRRKGCK
jgi:hypothetical protein